MIQHFLNDTEVFTEKDTSIKVTKENPVLTDSGSYTYDVNFPLSIAENKKFFGPLDRVEVSKQWVTYDVKVLNNGVPLLVGTAHVTKVSEDTVTVQYLAGNSNVRFWYNAEDEYIDEIDYNTMDDGKDIVKKYCNIPYESDYFESQIYKQDDESGDVYFTYWARYKDDVNTDEGAEYSIFRGAEHIFTFCKVYDTSHADDEQTIAAFGNGERFNSLTPRSKNLIIYCNCIQPNLLWILGQICKKRGYTLDASILSGTPAEDIYIASARQTLKLAEALPHWTVKEFTEQVQNLFNITIVFDDAKSIALVSGNEDLLGEDTVMLESMADEREIEIDEEDQITTLDNVKYDDWEDDFKIIASEEVREKNHVKVESDEAADVLIQMEADEKSISYDSLYVDKKGKRYLYDDENSVAVEIDKFGPISTDYDNARELKIHPAKTILRQYRDNYFEIKLDLGGGESRVTAYKFFHDEVVLEMGNTWGGYTNTNKSLYEKLVDDDDISQRSKEDELQIFLASRNGDGKRMENVFKVQSMIEKQDGTRYIPEGWDEITCVTNEEIDALGITEIDKSKLHFWQIPVSEPHIEKEYLARDDYAGRVDGSLRLKCGSIASWYIGMRFKDKVGYMPKVVHELPFFSNTIPDVRARFLIHGKSFACQKIEYNIDDDGIIPLMTGYFIEMEN